jgi:hypothetical protein
VTNHVEQELASLRERLQRCESKARLALDCLQAVEQVLTAQPNPPLLTLADLIDYVQQTRQLLTCGEGQP